MIPTLIGNQVLHYISALSQIKAVHETHQEYSTDKAHAIARSKK